MTAAKEPKTWRGRAHAGWLTTNYPFFPDTLTVSATELTINSPLGNFTFGRDSVVRIERSGFAPFLWTGIMIRHRVAAYPKSIGFWPKGISTERILQELESFGYSLG